MSDVSCCDDIDVEVHLMLEALEVLITLSLDGGSLILYSPSSLPAPMTGLWGVSLAYCPHN